MGSDSHRRVPLDPNLLVHDMVSQRVLYPSSAAFAPDPGEDGLSVYRESLLTECGCDAAAVAGAGIKKATVAGVTDVVVNSTDLHITPDPQPEPADIGPAHALIQGWDGLSRKEARNRARALARSSCCLHPEGPWEAIQLASA